MRSGGAPRPDNDPERLVQRADPGHGKSPTAPMIPAQEVAEAFVTIAGPQGVLRRGTEHAPLDGRFENYYQFSVQRP